MKIVCGNCSAKYSISDDKVQGKVFKVRCRKCGESIVVRGETHSDDDVGSPPPLPAAPDFPAEEGDAETRVFDYSGYQAENAPVESNEWHIVVDGNQQGPYTADQIKEHIASGSLDLDTFIWRDGFSDWIPAREVREFADAGTAARAAPPAAEYESEFSARTEPAFDTGSDPSSGGRGGKRSDAQLSSGDVTDSDELFGATLHREPDLFSAMPQSLPTTGGLFSDNSGMFGPEQTAAAEEFTGVSDVFVDPGSTADGDLFGAPEPVKGGPGPRLSAEQIMMTGQRNESSVLFSLSSLQSLAASQEASKQPVVTNTGGSEGSGLIDIRALAGALHQVESEAPAQQADDDLFSIGNFSGGLTAPVLAPALRGGMSTGIKVAIFTGLGVGACVIVVLVVLLMQMQKQSQPNADVQALLDKISALQKGGGADSAQMAELQAQLANVKAEPTGTSEPQGSAETPQEEPKATEKESAKRDRGASRTAGAGGGGATGKAAPAAAAPATETPREAAPAAPSGSSGKKPVSSELDDLLGDSKGQSGSKKPAAEPTKPAESPKAAGGGNGGVKDSLDRMDVQAGMNSVAAMVKQCGQGEQGTVTLQVVISPTGRVATAEPTGSFAGTPVGACAARAVRTAKFPASKNSLSVRYPFKL